MNLHNAALGPENKLDDCPPSLLSPKQVAARLAVSRKTILRWVQQGEFGDIVYLSERSLRIEAAALGRFIEKRRVSKVAGWKGC